MDNKSLFQVVKWLMIIAGTWELELTGASETGKKIYKFYSVVICIAYHTCHVSFLIKLCELWGVDNDKAVECLSMLIIVFLLAIKMALCRRKQMTTVLKNSMEKVNLVSLDGHEHVKNIFTSYARYANILNVFLTIWSFYVGLFLTVGGVFEYKEFKRTRNISEEHVEIPLQVLYWYPFDYEKHFNWVLGYQFFTILFSDLYNGCLQSLFNTIMIQISVDLKVLQYSFKRFTKERQAEREVSREEAYSKLKDCIRKHQKLLEHTGELNKALKYTLFIEYAVSSVMLASILVQVISGKKPLFNSLYFGILAFQWCVLSWNANEITLQSENLSAALYESNWYEQGKATNQLIFIIVMRTKRPLYIQIGPFGSLTIHAGISRLKLAYSYISLMSS